MKALPTTLVLLFVTTCAFAQTPAPHVDWVTAPVIVFEHVNVIPMDEERVLNDQTVMIEAGRIVEVGPASVVQVPENALVIDGQGKYLLPGLAEMHGHIPPPDQPEKQVEETLFMYVANGVTTVRGMLGWPGNLELREQANRGELIAPTLYLAGPSFSGGSVDSPEQAAERVRQQKAEGWDLLKVHPGLSLEEYDAMARAAQEVGIRFAGHVPSEVGLVHAIKRGQDTFDHLDGYIEYLKGHERVLTDDEIAEVVQMTLDADAAVVPTMPLWEIIVGAADLETLTAYPELQYMPPRVVQAWTESHRNRLANPNLNREQAQRIVENRQRLLRAMNEAGVKILLGTDTPQFFSVPGFSLHREFLRMEEAGMTPYEILVSGTRNVGDYFRSKDAFGTVSVGKRADLILVDANPLESIHNVHRISGVMVRGRWLPKETIEARLKQIANSYQ